MFAWFKWAALFSDWREFVTGFGVTVAVSFIALLFALFIGFIGGLAKYASSRVIKKIVGAYESFFQNTPLVIQVFFLYNVLPI